MNPVIWNLGLLALGMLLLMAGGKFLVDAAVNIATRLRIPPLLVGLTIVAWGTSAPELAFNTISAWHDRGPLVLGNAVGSNICNIGLILGLCALIRPLAVADDIIRRELPLTVALFALVFVLGFAGSTLGRIDAAVLLAFFAAYSFWTIRQGLSRRNAVGEIDTQTIAHTQGRTDGQAEDQSPRLRPLPVALTAMLIGVALLAAGGSLAAEAAVGIARTLGVPETIVGLTIVSIGTTLPELLTGVIATRRGHVDLAVGNVVGSSLFNAGAILGVAGLVVPTPITLSTEALVSVGVMLALGLVLFPMTRTFQRTIARIEGLMLLGAYALFLIYQAWRAAGTAQAVIP